MGETMKKQAGFTLVDMAMMLAVAGVLTASLLSTNTVKKESKYLSASTTHLGEIHDAIAQHYVKFGYVPCPASATTAPNTATFGKSTDCSAAAVAGVSDPAIPTGYSATDAIRIGVVPTRTLALPDSYMFDEWGNRLTYTTIKKLAIDATNFTAYTTTVTTGVLRINDSTGTQISSNDPTNFTAYVLVSHGKDGKGSYSTKGTANAACDSTNLDKENCNSDYVFMNSVISDYAQGASYFYDLVTYANKSDVGAMSEAVTSSTTISKALGMGGWNACGIKADGTGWCWGYNRWGEIGNGTSATDGSTQSALPVAVSNAGTGLWKQMDTGNWHACGIQSDDTLWCWGSNHYGQTTVGTKTVPTKVGTMTWKHITAGDMSTCGIQTDNTAWCWGFNGSGQVGNGASGGNITTPTAVSGGGSWSVIETGGNVNYAGDPAHDGSTCGIKTDGTLWCWGANTYGQLGINSTTNQSTPQQVLVGTTWKVITVGETNACAIKSDDTMWCWGQGAGYRNGDNTTTNRLVPTQIGTATWRTMSSGGSPAQTQNHTCAIKTDDTMWCWGGGALGEGGDNDWTANMVPEAVTGGGAWEAVSSGNQASCGVKSDGTLWCWGFVDQVGVTACTNDPYCLKPTQVNVTGTW
jgi:alpha-tubulin suppressor-like RCC1 family protein/Tfp pilus assembly protein PilE